MTHDELVAISAKWLKSHPENLIVPNCSLIVEEMYSANLTGEIPDVIGWCSWASVVIEDKVSRADFLKDKRKGFRQIGGMGEFNYYCCPADTITVKDLPDNWGLLYCDENHRISIIKKATKQETNLLSERSLLLSIIRRK